MKRHWHKYRKENNKTVFESKALTEEQAQYTKEDYDWYLSGDNREIGYFFCTGKHDAIPCPLEKQ